MSRFLRSAGEAGCPAKSDQCDDGGCGVPQRDGEAQPVLEPLTGEQVDKISNDTLETPKDVLALVQKLVKVK